MAKIISFRKKTENVPDYLITAYPWEFRRPEWGSKYFIQILKSHWEEIESQIEKSSKPPPSCFVLKDSMANTIMGIYDYRDNMEKMREVYYLAGLIDCMINQVNALLRTDHISAMYNKVTTLKRILEVNWYGSMDQVLFPIDSRLYNHHEYRKRLSGTATMKDLYRIIREGTDEMFDILSSKYVFFTPGEGA